MIIYKDCPTKSETFNNVIKPTECTGKLMRATTIGKISLLLYRFRDCSLTVQQWKSVSEMLGRKVDPTSFTQNLIRYSSTKVPYFIRHTGFDTTYAWAHNYTYPFTSFSEKDFEPVIDISTYVPVAVAKPNSFFFDPFNRIQPT